MKRCFLILSVIFFLSNFSYSEKSYLGTVTVSGVKDTFTSLDNTQKTYIITSEDIKDMGADSLDDIFKSVPSLTIEQRGADDLQSDIRFRGASFEQTLIFVDGVPMNNRQTGHHNLDLPVSIQDIDRIEIIPSAGSLVHGSGSYAGTIHIITRDRNKYSGTLTVGMNDYYAMSLGLPLESKKFHTNISLDKKVSSGYRVDTDFDINKLWLHSIYNMEASDLHFYLGYLDKDLGANEFYGPSESREKIDSLFFKVYSDYQLVDKYTLAYDLFYKRYNDEFVYNRFTPNAKNEHTTDSYGTDIKVIREEEDCRLVGGVALRTDNIDSNNLGERHEDSLGLYAMLSKDISLWKYTLGLRYDSYKVYEDVFLPYVGFGRSFGDYWTARASVGKSYRLPSFTERFYVSPWNIGNTKLEPEKTNNYDLGFSFNKDTISWDTTLFLRDEDDVIDWSKSSVNQIAWIANNLREVLACGVEVSLDKKLTDKIKSSLSYTYTNLDTDVPTGYISKYTLNYVRNCVIMSLTSPVVFGINSYTQYTYNDRMNNNDYSLVDLVLRRDVRKGSVYFKMDNAFNVHYREVNSIPMPGRWVYAGYEIEL